MLCYHIPLLEQQGRCCYITTTVTAVCVGRFPTNRSNGAAIELLLFWLCCGCVRKPHQPLRKRKKKTRLMVCRNSGSGSFMWLEWQWLEFCSCCSKQEQCFIIQDVPQWTVFRKSFLSLVLWSIQATHVGCVGFLNDILIFDLKAVPCPATLREEAVHGLNLCSCYALVVCIGLCGFNKLTQFPSSSSSRPHTCLYS